MKPNRWMAAVATLLGALPGVAQEPTPPTSLREASSAMTQKLEQSVAELNLVTEQIAGEKLPLNRRLHELEAELLRVRSEFDERTHAFETRRLDVSGLRSDIDKRRQEASYLANLFSEYARNFESRLHIAERQRYAEVLEQANLAPEKSGLSQEQVFAAQAALVHASLERLDDALGGTLFKGRAVDANGLVSQGTFALLGPAALFRSADGRDVGTAELRLGSLEPAAIAFTDPAHAAAASKLVEAGAGSFPLDPTLGNANKIAATSETFLEHVQKGGPVMVPIFVLAAAALLVVLLKWLGLSMVPKPSWARIESLLNAVGRRDEDAAKREATAIRGPVGRMLAAGVEHLREPRELIEEVMYERVLATRLKTQSFLPFIAICAASAPLLGLLGTVTGIISTFNLITIFGSSDVKLLSSGISEALITTKFGLIVAIPSLLLHAYLARKARSIVGQMERAAMALLNEVGKTPLSGTLHRAEAPLADAGTAALDVEAVRSHVKEILHEMLGPLHEGRGRQPGGAGGAGGVQGAAGKSNSEHGQLAAQRRA